MPEPSGWMAKERAKRMEVLVNDLRHALMDALNSMKRDSPEAERVWENGRAVLKRVGSHIDGSAAP